MATSLKVPVKIGPFRFKFVETNLNPGSEESFHFGLTSLENTTCHIHHQMDIDVKRETHLHEALHVVAMVTGLSERLKEGEEEDIIQALSPTLLDMLQSNPEFTKFILGWE